jgi:hypothetical protein
VTGWARRRRGVTAASPVIAHRASPRISQCLDSSGAW